MFPVLFRGIPFLDTPAFSTDDPGTAAATVLTVGDQALQKPQSTHSQRTGTQHPAGFQELGSSLSHCDHIRGSWQAVLSSSQNPI